VTAVAAAIIVNRNGCRNEGRGYEEMRMLEFGEDGSETVILPIRERALIQLTSIGKRHKEKKNQVTESLDTSMVNEVSTTSHST
jgi:hypothetical protein